MHLQKNGMLKHLKRRLIRQNNNFILNSNSKSIFWKSIWSSNRWGNVDKYVTCRSQAQKQAYMALGRWHFCCAHLSKTSSAHDENLFWVAETFYGERGGGLTATR